MTCVRPTKELSNSLSRLGSRTGIGVTDNLRLGCLDSSARIDCEIVFLIRNPINYDVGNLPTI
uniref:Uncharacterized protein n=1 Tax=Strigamia maritima TaxID=126957 RepID=T1JAL6_STRMM